MLSNKELKRYWDVSYKGVPIYGYIIHKIESDVQTAYKPHFKFSLRDVFGFFKFISIKFSSIKKVVFIPDRTDMICFVKQEIPSPKYTFIRGENSPGDVFFLEAIRWFLRKLVKLTHNRISVKLEERINSIGNSNYKLRSDIYNFLGDYYFNIVLSWFLSGKQVYYSNCLVPKIEKYMGLFNSIELQHGVIYKRHLDYRCIPRGKIKGGFLAWNSFWAKVLTEQCNYPTDVSHGNYFGEEVSRDKSPKRLILTTVNEEFSRLIINIYNEKDTVLRLHPRDAFNYKDNGFIGEVERFKELMSYREIICSDTTLIRSLVLTDVKFKYLAMDFEDDYNIKQKLYLKYKAEHLKHYDIIRK